MIACELVWPITVVVIVALIVTGVVAYAAVTHYAAPEGE